MGLSIPAIVAIVVVAFLITCAAVVVYYCRRGAAVECVHIPRSASNTKKELKESLRSGGEEGLNSPRHRRTRSTPDTHEYGNFEVTVGEKEHNDHDDELDVVSPQPLS